MQEIYITKETAGGRMDKLLMRYLDQAGAGFVYKMLRKKNILLNDRKASGSELLREGDCIRLYLADDTIRKFRSAEENNIIYSAKSAMQRVNSAEYRDNASVSPEFHSWIVYEDANLLAVSKPQGVLSQKSSSGDISLNEMIKSYLGTDNIFVPGIANRLDRNTSGLVLAGKNPAAQRSLSLAIRNRGLKKYYLCIVKGNVVKDDSAEACLSKNPETNLVCIHEGMPDEEKREQYIRTDYKVLSHGKRCSLLKVDLVTGRSHQIRAHMAYLGHPVIGDVKYGDPQINRLFREKYQIKWQMLHACEVRFVNMTGVLEELNGKNIQAKAPETFYKVASGEHLDAGLLL